MVVPISRIQVVATSSFQTTNHSNSSEYTGTATPSVLVNKGWGNKLMSAASLAAAPFTGGVSLAANAARIAAVQAGKKIATKIGVKGAAAAGGAVAANTGKNTLVAPLTTGAAGNSVPVLKPSGTGASSMASQSISNMADDSSKVAVTESPQPSANPVGDAGGEGAAPWMRGGAGFEEAQRSAATAGEVKVNPSTTIENLQNRGAEPTEKVSELDNVPTQDPSPATMDDAENAAKVAVSDATGKQKTRDTLQNVVLAQQMYSGAKAKKDAEAASEIQRVEGLAESAKAKASTGTGGQVAVA